MLKGIDLSHHNEPFDLSGYDFALIRAGYGRRPNTDKLFDKHVCNAINAKLHIGFYWFIYATTIEEAKANAIAFLSTIERYSDFIDLPLYSDLEYDSETKYPTVTFTRELRTSIVNTFNHIIGEKGYKFGTYANVDYLQNKFNSDLDIGSLWLAQWNDKYDTKYVPDIWQYTNKLTNPKGGKLDGNCLINDNIINNNSDSNSTDNNTNNEHLCPHCGRPIRIIIQ